MKRLSLGTVRGTAFAAAAENGSAAVEAVAEAKDAGVSKFAEEIVKLDRPELTAARIVVSGGRGVGSGENYHKVLDPLADKTWCCSRCFTCSGRWALYQTTSKLVKLVKIVCARSLLGNRYLWCDSA